MLHWIGKSHRVLDDGHHKFGDMAASIIAAERHRTGWERLSARELGHKGEVALTLGSTTQDFVTKDIDLRS